MTQGRLFDLNHDLSMETQQIKDSLRRLFAEGKYRIVFWYDPEKDFEETVKSLELAGITILNQNDHPSLALKVRLELEDREGRYLIYAPFEEPAPENDWLLDIRLYSHTFRADQASLIINELGLNSQALRPFISSRKAFFLSQERRNKLKKWVSPTDGETDLDLKMLTVVAKADHPEVFSICLSLFSGFCPGGRFIPDQTPPLWEEIEKYGLAPTFWDLMAKTFGYTAENPKLTDLLIRLLVMDFASTLKTDLPPSLDHFKLGPVLLGLNASVFVAQWRNHMGYHQQFNQIANHYEKLLKIEEIIDNYSIGDLLEVMTFETVEKKIIREIRDRIPSIDSQNDFGHLSQVINQRLNGYWAGRLTGEKNQTNLFRRTYNALSSAIELFQHRLKFESGLSYPSPQSMFKAYAEELFLFDQNYRRFHLEADQVEMGGWDVLKSLQTAVEDCYSGWFMDQLALAWGGFLEVEGGPGLIENWSLPDFKKQFSFFKEFVQGVLDASPRNKVFVIISDAFRYEAAKELAGEFNGKYRFKADLEPVLGVLPSYTALGMAALLPHKSLSYSETGDILVNGKPVGGLEQRASILAEYQGAAIRAGDLMSMNKLQGREFIRPYRLIYVYHNQIDAVGDKQASEHKTFEAVAKTIEEVGALVSFIINSLNGGYVVVTADHGFIYQDKSPEQIDKSTLEVKPSGAVIAKKRYIVGRNLGRSSKVWSGNTKVTAGTDPSMNFWVPKGTNRFHFTGGSRFFHGGAMLQEIVVPVMVVKELRGREREQSAIRLVGVSLLGTIKKIVTNRHRFEFIQTDSVSERVRPRKLMVSLREGNELISNEEMVTFDSESSSIDERKKSVMMTLKAKDYDNKKEYSLVLRDPETEIEYARIPIHIDLAFKDEF